MKVGFFIAGVDPISSALHASHFYRQIVRIKVEEQCLLGLLTPKTDWFRLAGLLCMCPAYFGNRSGRPLDPTNKPIHDDDARKFYSR